jgi:tubulysin polyketide synthase-like protein
MSASLLDELRDRGIRLEVRSNGNIYVAPKSRLTADVLDRIRRHKPELLALLEQKRLSFAQVEARRLIRMCKEYGVGLRLEPDSTLVVTSNGRAWRSLVDTIEANVEAVADLILAGWDGSDA